MMVVILTDSHCALTAPSITRIPSLTKTLLHNFILSLDCGLLLICKRQNDYPLNNCQSTGFEVSNVHLARTTHAHTQPTYHVSYCRN